MTIRDIAIAFGVEVDNASVNKAESAIKGLKSYATKALAMIGITFSLTKMKDLVEEWYSVNKVIATVNTELASQTDLQNKILEAANGCKMAYSDMADYVASLVKTGSSFFTTAEDAAEFLELANQLFQVSGATSSEISSLNSVLTTTFNTGKLSASGFNTIMSACPEIVEYLASSLGMTTQQVKALGLSGSITAKQLYNALYGSAEAITDAYDNLSLTISDALTIIKNNWGTWLSQMDETYDVTNTIAKFMVRAFNQILAVLKSVMNMFDRLVMLLGSTRNAVIFLTAAISALVVAFKWQSIVSGLKSISSALTGVAGKVLIIVGIVILIIALIDDLIAFANGDESLIGSMFEKAGVDAEGFRSALQSLFKVIQQVFNMIVPVIQKLVNTLLPILQKLMSANLEVMAKILEVVIGVVVALLDMLMPVIEALIDILDAVISFLEPIIDLFMVLVDIVVALVEVVLELIKPLLELLTACLQPIFDIVELLVDSLGNQLSDAFSFVGSIIDSIVSGPLSSLLTYLQYIIKFISSVFSGDWESAWKALGNIPIAIINGIISGFESLINFFVKAINSITSSLSSLWTWIGIPAIPSIPEVSFGRISYLAEGGYIGPNQPTPVVIGDNKTEGEIVAPESKLRKAVTDALALYDGEGSKDVQKTTSIGALLAAALSPAVRLLEQIKALISDRFNEYDEDDDDGDNFPVGFIDTMRSYFSRDNGKDNQRAAQTLQNNVTNKSITQNVYMYNTFEGSKDVQKTTSKAMRSSADDLTTELANAIAYTR